MRYNFYPPKFFETFLWPNVIYMEGIPRALEQDGILFGYSVLQLCNSNCPVVSFKITVFLLSFCLENLSVDLSSGIKVPYSGHIVSSSLHIYEYLYIQFSHILKDVHFYSPPSHFVSLESYFISLCLSLHHLSQLKLILQLLSFNFCNSLFE